MTMRINILSLALLIYPVLGTEQCFPTITYTSGCDDPCGAGYNNQGHVDVAILGAGMAGVMAASTIEEVSESEGIEYTYILLEAKDKVGGKMQKSALDETCFGVGQDGRPISPEDGANWIGGGPGNPVFQLAMEYDLRIFQQNFYDTKSFDEDGKTLGNFKAELFRYDRNAYECVNDAARQLYGNFSNGLGEPNPVPSVQDALVDCGYIVGDSGLLEQVTWFSVDYGTHSSPNTTSLASSPEYTYIDFVDDRGIYDEYFVVDTDGYEKLPTMKSQELQEGRLQNNTEVCSVDYSGASTDPVVIRTADCKEWTATKVISTFGNSVMRQRTDLFNPPINGTENPNDTGDYQKIFYQFPEAFWPNNVEYLNFILPPEDRGRCNWFQNLNFDRKGQPQKLGDGMWQGSNMLFCLVTTDAFAVINEDPITNETALTFLNPLRAAYGSDFVEPTKLYIPNWRQDPFNYGADYWPNGFGYQDHKDFYSPRGEGDKVFISGSASCLRYNNWVHGAYLGGVRSARQALESLAGGSFPWTYESICDVYGD